MKVSQDDSSFSSAGVADCMSSAKLVETRAPSKEAELVRCVVDLAQANERLATVQVSNLQEQLHLARHECDEMKQRVITVEQEKSDMEPSSLAGLTARMTDLEESLQSQQLAASQERDELKQRIVALEQGKSDSRMTSLEESLQLACQDHDELKHRVVTLEQEKSDFLMELSSLKGLAAQMTSIQEALQLASQERNELKQRFITVEQEKSDILMGLSNLN